MQKRTVMVQSNALMRFMDAAADLLNKLKEPDANPDLTVASGQPRDFDIGPGMYVVVQVVEASGPTLKAVAVAPSTLYGWSYGAKA